MLILLIPIVGRALWCVHFVTQFKSFKRTPSIVMSEQVAKYLRTRLFWYVEQWIVGTWVLSVVVVLSKPLDELRLMKRLVRRLLWIMSMSTHRVMLWMYNKSFYTLDSKFCTFLKMHPNWAFADCMLELIEITIYLHTRLMNLQELFEAKLNFKH